MRKNREELRKKNRLNKQDWKKRQEMLKYRNKPKKEERQFKKE